MTISKLILVFRGVCGLAHRSYYNNTHITDYCVKMVINMNRSASRIVQLLTTNSTDVLARRILFGCGSGAMYGLMGTTDFKPIHHGIYGRCKDTFKERTANTAARTVSFGALGAFVGVFVLPILIVGIPSVGICVMEDVYHKQYDTFEADSD
jgi:hypothetical protein